MRKRPGRTATFSISVDVETQRILKREATRSYGGNVSALVAAIAKEARRQAAFDWLLAGRDITDEQRAEFLAEVEGKRRAKKRRGKAA
jgi:post-segregation antitoxin (ccd killing protein)